MDIQVGDRVTYKNKDRNTIAVETATSDYDITVLSREHIEILKIERPTYEVIEEKKELLTEEEKEFLKDITKWYNNISTIMFNQYIDMHEGSYCVSCLDYPSNVTFGGIEKNKDYTLEELGIN